MDNSYLLTLEIRLQRIPLNNIMKNKLPVLLPLKNYQNTATSILNNLQKCNKTYQN